MCVEDSGSVSVSPTAFGCDLSAASCHELDVAHLQDGREQLEHVSDLLLGELHHLQRLLRGEHNELVCFSQSQNTHTLQSILQNS